MHSAVANFSPVPDHCVPRSDYHAENRSRGVPSGIGDLAVPQSVIERSVDRLRIGIVGV